MRIRFDRTLRVVMWWDAFLSVALTGVAMIASPIVVGFGLPGAVVPALGVATLVLSGLLAAFGAITGVVLMVRMRAGHYNLPAGLHLPLPAVMDPTRRRSR